MQTTVIIPIEFIVIGRDHLHSKTSILKDSVIGFIVVAILDEKIVGTGTLVDRRNITSIC